MSDIGKVPTLDYLTARLQYLTDPKDIRRVTAKAGLNVRDIPLGRVVDALPYGAEVEVLDTIGAWCKIAQGWVSSSWLESV